MPPKSNENRKSILVIPSKVVSRPDALEGGEETEIAAQLSMPEEGGWGWIVVAASFSSIFILDGIVYTFGSIIGDIVVDLNTSDALIALINSVAVAIYLTAGPLVSAFINRFGFRACIMTGSVLSSFSLFMSYFAPNYASLCVFYGVFAGFGFSLINMSSGLIVGFYFEKLRSLALAIATCGSSIGVMALYPLNTILVRLGGWRTTTLLHSGLLGMIYFFGMTFRPLLSLTVMNTTDEPTRTVTYLPSLATVSSRTSPSRIKVETLVPTATERLFSAISNSNFPTAAAVVDDAQGIIAQPSSQPGPSNAPVSKLTLTANKPQGGLSRRQLKQVQSILSRASEQEKSKRGVEFTLNAEEPTKLSFWQRIFNWESHVPESRPLYRDDVFYQGKLDKLPAYQKSMLDTESAEPKSGLEYQLAVSRAATATDLRERRGVFTTAARRVLATMMDPKLLGLKSFLLLCFSGFFVYLGFLVPYVFLQDRNKLNGIDSKHCNLFVSAIGLANAIGRLVLGSLACKLDPLKLFAFSCFTAGISTMISSLSYDVYYQYCYCFIFGFFIASVASLRSQIIVNLYGLDKLTNATGMMLLFQGIGSLFSTPMAGAIKNALGYSYSFLIAGGFITISGILLIPVRTISLKEKENKTRKSIRKMNITQNVK